jgi:hypothetical protein
MAEVLYMRRGRLDDALSWEEIGLPCVDLGPCTADAERYTEHYSIVEVINRATCQVVYRALRR